MKCVALIIFSLLWPAFGTLLWFARTIKPFFIATIHHSLQFNVFLIRKTIVLFDFYTLLKSTASAGKLWMNEWTSKKYHRIFVLHSYFIAYLCLFTNRISIHACIRFTCRSHPGRSIYLREFANANELTKRPLRIIKCVLFFSFHRLANPKSMTKTKIRRLCASIYYYNYYYWSTFASHWRSSKIRLLRFRLYRYIYIYSLNAYY